MLTMVMLGDTAWSAPAADQLQQAKIEAGDLTLVVGNHMPHAGGERQKYEGIHHLSHRARPVNLFRPIYAGMIGVRGPCRVETIDATAAAIVSGEERGRVTETFRLRAPHYVDYAATFIPGGAQRHWNNTCYMNDLDTPALYVRTTEGHWARHYSEQHGHQASVAPEGMDPLPPVTRVDNPQYPHGSNHFHEGFSDLRFDPHFPVVYGRVENMVFIYMAERRLGASFIPYISPIGGGSRRNPAWDFRYWLRDLTPGDEVTVRIRLCYKPWVSEEDVVEEYERWQESLAAE